MDPAKGLGNPYGATGNTAGATDDAANMQMVGAAHFSVLKAAFICDIIRCGTFLWCPGTNHTGFKLYPGTTTTCTTQRATRSAPATRSPRRP
jgi:hypothetical protein